MTNNEKFMQLFNLMKENPDLPVVPMIYSEIVGCEGYGYWQGIWGEALVDKYLCTKDRVYFFSEGYDDVYEMELVLGDYDKEFAFPEIEDTKLYDEEITKMYCQLPWKKAIIVYIDLPED